MGKPKQKKDIATIRALNAALSATLTAAREASASAQRMAAFLHAHQDELPWDSNVAADIEKWYNEPDFFK